MSDLSTNPTGTTQQKEANQMNSYDPNNEIEISAYSRKALAAQTEAGISVLDQLVAAKHGGRMLKLDQLIADRDDEGKVILKPKAQALEETLMIVGREVEANARTVDNTRTFKARPYDGAIAFQEILRKIFGQAAQGSGAYGLPEVKQVQIDCHRDTEGSVVNDYAKVTWGVMEFAPLKAEFRLHEAYDEQYGHCFGIQFVCAKKWEDHVEALFNEVESYLLTHSIYKNKAIEGTEQVGPRIIDPYNIDRTKSVYTEPVERALLNSIFGPMQRADALRRQGIGLGEKILLAGTNGSGKSLACRSAMQVALEEGWTAIQCTPDEDIHKVVAFAERLAPAMVIVEDIEKVMSPEFSGSAKKMEKLLDLFDGAGSKGREVLLVMTTNHEYELSKSMLRPGRIDRIIKVGAMDRDSLEKLVKVVVGPERVAEVDFDTLGNVFIDCTPVWITQAISRAERSVIIRTGEPKAAFTTEDFLYEAEDLIEQLLQHRAATDRPDKPAIESAFKTLIDSRVNKALAPIYAKFDIEVKV